VDRNGSCLLTGYYDEAVAFGTNVLFTSGFFDLFVAKYNGQGELLWARNTPSNSAINGAGIAGDAEGNGYVIGSFVGSAVFGAVTFTNTDHYATFLAKYDGDGNLAWAKRAGGASDTSGYGVAVDQAGTCYATGSMSGLAQFGLRTLSTAGKSDSVIAKLLSSSAAAPSFLSIQPLSPLQFEVEFTGDGCAAYRLQVSTDLKQWTTLLTTNAPAGPVIYIENKAPAESQRFFRALSP
jgi:hypothetical protein